MITPHVYRFASGPDTDHAAVRNGLTLPYSSGAVEEHVNRIKMLKRQMYATRRIRPAPQANTPQQLTHSESITESEPEPGFDRRSYRAAA